VAISYRELTDSIVFKVTPLHGPQEKRRLLLLRMRFYSFVAWQQTSYCSVRLLRADHIETALLLLLSVFVAVRMISHMSQYITAALDDFGIYVIRTVQQSRGNELPIVEKSRET
jgi:hypothetical protein